MAKIIKPGKLIFPQFVAEIISQRDKGNFHEFTGEATGFHHWKDRTWKDYPTSDITLTSTKPKLTEFRHIADYSKDGLKSTALATPQKDVGYLVNVREFLDYLQNSTLKADDFEFLFLTSPARGVVVFH